MTEFTAPLTGTAVYSFYGYYGFIFSFFFADFEYTEFPAVVRVDAVYSYRRLLVGRNSQSCLVGSEKDAGHRPSGGLGWSPSALGVLPSAHRLMEA